MKISYNWLKEYLPSDPETRKILESPERISQILTSVGLEVESLELFEEVRNSLEGVVIGLVITCEKHPDADRLKVTQVDTGTGTLLQIVCGAPNVAAGQKVAVALTGSVLYPSKGPSLSIKKAKIRGVESNGMLCAEDELGLGDSHEGILVLPPELQPGTEASGYFKPYRDWIFEIGLTPNRMDAMSHLGVAKDVCAYLSHHLKKEIRVVSPLAHKFQAGGAPGNIAVQVENPGLCARYSGVLISGIKIAPSPLWLQHRLKSIGIRPISNIVDVTNFILHETGQPLHSFDADKIRGNGIVVRTLPQGTPFVTLDGKSRTLNGEEIMICDQQGHPLCFGGVFGGLDSGVSETTTRIFLESAWFNPVLIRKASFRHHLRTEAAIRFEKGVDIGGTVSVLKRAALLIQELCGGEISSRVVDIYPEPRTQTEVTLSNHYLKKISGKNYHQDAVKNILKSLNFSIVKEGLDEIRVAVPFSNPDISLPADIIEEIMRIDGLDNIEIPSTIRMAPAVEPAGVEAALRERVAQWLTGNGFSEIFTNSITNGNYFEGPGKDEVVTIINSLSEGLNVMRPSLMPTGLETVAYNLNRKNEQLLFFEFGKTYSTTAKGKYRESEALSLFFCGNRRPGGWNSRPEKVDIFFVKGVCTTLLSLAGAQGAFQTSAHPQLGEHFSFTLAGGEVVAEGGRIAREVLERFSIRQPVYYLEIHWQKLKDRGLNPGRISFAEVQKFPAVQRDLAIVVDQKVAYRQIEESVDALGMRRLAGYQLFDVFESEKIGAGRKSLAMSFTFQDPGKTLTDEETDQMMQKIIKTLEKDLEAEIRRNN